jgi:hypothetical protein
MFWSVVQRENKRNARPVPIEIPINPAIIVASRSFRELWLKNAHAFI